MGDSEMESEDFLTHIRFKSSFETNMNRVEKRAFHHNARRTNYDKVAKRIKVSSLEEFRKICQYFSQDKKLKDLERIHQGLVSGQQYIRVFLETEGALYSLIGCFSGINTKLHVGALNCIINLGLGTEEQSLRVCRRAGSYLVTCLGNNNTQIQGLCCWAFGNLCGTYPKVCALILSQGFEDVISCALSSHSPSVVQWGCYALNHYINTVSHRIKEFFKPELLKRLLTALSSDKEYINDSCWCLFTVSTEPDLCYSLVNFGVVSASLSVLLEMTKCDSLDVGTATALVRVLSNCVAALNELAIEICYRVDDFVSIVKFLLYSPCIHLQKETMQMVANVVNGAMKQSVTGQNVLEDTNLRRKLEPILRQNLVSEFKDSQTPNYEFLLQYLN